ncbi:MAG: alpha/beta hydrolase [bacterium]|nr:alpha/beta hydrolase [bacterium]
MGIVEGVLSREISFKWEGIELSGSLHLPVGSQPHPVVLMMQGSGPADRNNDGYFPEIRPAFLSRSVATFSFDKPGCGTSTGDWRNYGLIGRADQAEAAIAALRAQPHIDPDRVGVWGQSQGGWLAQLLASRPLNLAFAIANSGPSIGVVEQNLYGCEHSMRAAAHSEPDIRSAIEFIDVLHQAAQRNAAFSEISPLVAAVESQAWYGYAEVEDEADWHFSRLLVREAYDPLQALANAHCSFLAIYGARDVLVPAWRGAEESSRALAESGVAQSAVMVFPTGDHRIRDTATGGFAAGYLDLLGDWAARQV